MSRRRADTDGGLDGVLVVDKAAGPTSHDVVGLVRRLAGTRRIGHGGTLDPFASGVLPLFLGSATRLAEYHLGRDKRYRATVCFGASSTTDDLEGELTPVPTAPDRATLVDALAAFRGPLEQRPPDFSAVKVGGRRAYAMARAGVVPELRTRTVKIQRLELIGWVDEDPSRPIATMEVACSAGTYVRSLARDLGVATGGAAYLGSLVRTASGDFELGDAITVDGIREAAASGGQAGVAELLRPVDAGLEWMPSVIVHPTSIPRLIQGQPVRPMPTADGEEEAEGPVRVLDDTGRLVAIGEWRDGRISPRKVLVRPAPTSGDAAAEAGEDSVAEPGEVRA